MSAVEVVCFDGDETLWDFQASMRSGLADVLERLRQTRPNVGPVDVESVIADREQVAEAMPGASVAAIRRAAFGRTLERLSVPDAALADELCAYYMERRRAATVTYPDVVPALRQLRKHYELALLSNGNTYPRHAGLEEYFGVVLYADDCGLRKPDGRIFAEMARRCDRDASRLAMVGDSLDHDVVGASNAGWRAIWLNRDGAACPPEVRPDAIVTTLADVGAVLAGGR